MGCSGSKAAGAAKSTSEKDPETMASEEEERIMANMNHKRRYKNVFAESVEISSAEKEITAAMSKTDTTKALIKEALQKNFVFATLTPEEMDKFVGYMEKQQVSAGEKLIKQGDQGDYFYVVEKGTFDFVKDGKTLGSTKEGDKASFGELALLYNAPRAATCQCGKTPATVWKLDRQTFRSTLANSSSKQKEAIMSALARVELLAGLSEQQLEQVSDAVQIVKYGPEHRIIEKNTKGDIFYMIQTGQVICTDIGDGQFDDVTLGPSDYFGEKAILENDTRAANVKALTDVTLLVLDRENFQQVLGPLQSVLDENLNMRIIGSIELFGGLNERERQKTIKLFKLRPYPAKVNIIEANTEGDEFFILRKGKAEVVVNDAVVKTIKAGDYVGEMALLSADKRTATVRTIEPTECFVISRDDFTKAMGPLKDIMERKGVERMGEIDQAVKEAARNDIKFEDLEFVAVLGSGTFGRVKLMKHKTSGEAFALKTMHKSEIVAHRQQANVMHEKNIMVQSKHPFILCLYNTYKDAHRLYMLLEFVQGGELFTVLHTPTSDGVAPKHAKFYGACVVMGLGYLHSKLIAYRDLKPENIMVDKTGYTKIVDFGFAKVVKNKTYTLCGTPEYLAPEIVLGRGHNKSVDWWAVGVLIYEMVAGYSPFSDPHGMDQVVICQNIVNGRLSFPNKFDAACRDIVKKLLQRDPVLRLGSGRRGEEDIREHRFFEKMAWDDLLAKKEKAPWLPPVKGDLDTSQFEPYEINDAIDPNYVDSGNWDKDF